MNYCGIKFSDVVNGKGVRTTIFVSGCRNHCEGCFNPESWDFGFGKEFTDDVKQSIFDEMDEYHQGITLLGGDPMEPENLECLTPFVKEFKSRFPDKDIWCYTGYLFEDLKDKEILQYIDILIDGKFDISKRSVNLPFRGSSNQRIIKVQESLKSNEIVLR